MDDEELKIGFFDNLKDLGFDNLNEVPLYVSAEKSKQNSTVKVNEFNPADLLYDKKVICPVCDKEIYIKTVKTRGIHLISQDTDFMPIYSEPNPLFYGVWMCTHCGYAALSSKFTPLGDRSIKLVKEFITPKLRFNKTYPPVYTVDNAIEMHQMALLNSLVLQSKDSMKAFICLKLSWLYRIQNDKLNERKFQLQVQQGFIKALEYEHFPIFGMDETSLEYLVGEIYRRLGDNPSALLWYSRVIASKYAKQKIKNLARDQKDAIYSLQKK